MKPSVSALAGVVLVTSGWVSVPAVAFPQHDHAMAPRAFTAASGTYAHSTTAQDGGCDVPRKLVGLRLRHLQRRARRPGCTSALEFRFRCAARADQAAVGAVGLAPGGVMPIET